jgi:hypothetical protein
MMVVGEDISFVAICETRFGFLDKSIVVGGFIGHTNLVGDCFFISHSVSTCLAF